MNIIKLTPNPSGSRPPIQSFSGPLPPGYGIVAPGVDTSAMQTHMGFVDLEVDGRTVTAITGNEALYQAYLDSLPPEPELEPTVEERLEVVEANKADKTEVAAITEAIERGLAL